MKKSEEGSRETSTDNFFSYKRIELRCVADLRRLRDLAEQRDLNPEVVELTDDVLRRAENKCFSIAVVGEFKRGKSTLINALLGREILPVDVLPCSATLNRITYGLKPSVSIYYKDESEGGRRVEEIGIDQLNDYVTKLTPESEENASQIEEAVIQYPSEYCRNNVDIFDTPGLNDDETMTAVTMSVIPKVDAAILVIMPEAPFSHYEGEFLADHLLLQDLGRVMFVVTAMDRLRRAKDRERIIEEIKNRINKAVEKRLADQFEKDSEDYQFYRQQIGQPKVFPLSAYLALEAQEKNDDELMEESQFPAFTVALEKFLTNTRGAIELQVLANRILATGEELLKKINIELGALQMAKHEFDEAYEAALADLEGLRRRRDDELAKIDDAAERTKRRLVPMVDQLQEELKDQASSVIDEATISSNELKKRNRPDLVERLGGEISKALSQTGRRGAERSQVEIERDLQAEIHRLHDFASTVGETLHGIELSFGTMDAEGEGPRNAAAESVAAAVSAVTGFGGIWSGYREAGLKGAAVGGAASLGTLVVGGLMAAALGLTLSLPVILGLSIATIFTGGWTARRLFGGDKVEKFRERYREAALERIESQLREQDLPAKVVENVVKIYDELKDGIIGELTMSMNQTQSTLDQLREEKLRGETLGERKRVEAEQDRAEIQGIRVKALRLCNQLAEISDV